MPEKKTTTCPCGEEIEIPFIDGEYDICNVECPKCERKATGGNTRLGTVDSWMTRAAIDRSNAVYEAQMFDVDNNELYGRGNW